MENEFESKKNQCIIEATDENVMLGMYVAKTLYRKWFEDFVDESSGQVESIERNEIILKQGEKITNDNIQMIMFHMQAGDIESVCITDQHREGSEMKTYHISPFIVGVSFKQKVHKFITYANGVRTAIEIIGDWCEQCFSGDFAITSVKTLDYSYLIIDSKKELNSDDNGNYNESYKNKFYQLDVIVTRDEYRMECTTSFTVNARSAERCLELININLQRDAAKQAEMNKTDIQSVTAEIDQCKQLTIDAIIPYQFASTYINIQE